MGRRFATLSIALIVIASWPPVSARAEADGASAVADTPREAVCIAPADAREHDGEECDVEMVVESSRGLPDKNICFLNSSRNHRDDDNFTVVIRKGGLERLKADGIDAPAEHYLMATIRVHGTITLRDGKAQIMVDEPGQVVIVKPAEQP